MRKRIIVVASFASALSIGLAVPSGAGAATIVGETFAPVGPCPDNETRVQTTSPANRYAVPADGVVTSWSTEAGVGGAPPLKLKLLRPAGGDFTVVGESATETPSASGVNTFLTRIRVNTGDLLGRYRANGLGSCDRSGQAGYTMYVSTGDPAVASTTSGVGNIAGFQLNLSAILEPDADGDGFGDETQDGCPSDAALQGPCPAPPDTAPPDTTITKGPKDKTKKKQATFEFSGTDARVVASFECSLNGAPFSPCTSPTTVKGKKGKNTFSVRAIDAAGNVDGSPATDEWKVKKKKKK